VYEKDWNPRVEFQCPKCNAVFGIKETDDVPVLIVCPICWRSFTIVDAIRVMTAKELHASVQIAVDISEPGMGRIRVEKVKT
jgi:uncharacterized protein YbaR (Trm112 family)